MLARATIRAGDTTFVMPFNPVTANWGYQENAVSTDTIGGRVVQLLSVQVTGLTITSVAGSRSELQIAAEKIRQIMEYHISSLRPAIFRVPSRAWDFRVYLTAMPQMGWDVASTTYPYELQMSVDEDISGVKTKGLEAAALKRLFEGIGYSPAVHGGDPTAFDAIVKNVLAASQVVPADTGSGNGGGGGGGGGTTPSGIPQTTIDFQRAFERVFPSAHFLGICNCRKIIPHSGGTSSTWSEHSWGNAIDYTGSASQQNQMMAWARRNKGQFRVNNIIGPGPGCDCTHFDFFPSHAGQTPPCAHGNPPCN